MNLNNETNHEIIKYIELIYLKGRAHLQCYSSQIEVGIGFRPNFPLGLKTFN
jgi:hypothetical protein